MNGTRPLPLLLAALSLVGLGIASYLTVAHWGDQPIACGGVGDCNLVNSSEYATVAGLPVSALGGALYLGLALTAALWVRRARDDRLPVMYWGLALAGAGYALYLTYVELAILHAICVWCVTSAAILSVCLALSSWAVLFGGAAVEDGPPGSSPVRRASRR